ncbi:MAG: hypothetical protein LUE93_06625, partial [Bacteroides sp.]|nr:hypothetical protein [Bacteroides sp.]
MEIRVAFPACTPLPCSFKFMIIGILPIISITAKSTIKALSSCWKLNILNILHFLVFSTKIFFFEDFTIFLVRKNRAYLRNNKKDEKQKRAIGGHY